jgi:hypothetical protein
MPDPAPEEELEASGWTPPATVGGTWCRMTPDGIFETWPRTLTRAEVMPYEQRSDVIKALLGTATVTSR